MFIILSHHDIKCCMEALEDLPACERTEQECKTLEKLKLINYAQRQKAIAKGKLPATSVSVANPAAREV